MENVNSEEIYNLGISQINIGSGIEMTIKELACLIKDIVKFISLSLLRITLSIESILISTLFSNSSNFLFSKFDFTKNFII